MAAGLGRYFFLMRVLGKFTWENQPLPLPQKAGYACLHSATASSDHEYAFHGTLSLTFLPIAVSLVAWPARFLQSKQSSKNTLYPTCQDPRMNLLTVVWKGMQELGTSPPCLPPLRLSQREGIIYATGT